MKELTVDLDKLSSVVDHNEELGAVEKLSKNVDDHDANNKRKENKNTDGNLKVLKEKVKVPS